MPLTSNIDSMIELRSKMYTVNRPVIELRSKMYIVNQPFHEETGVSGAIFEQRATKAQINVRIRLVGSDYIVD